jgi:hypothetical protein
MVLTLLLYFGQIITQDWAVLVLADTDIAVEADIVFVQFQATEFLRHFRVTDNQ